jgi:hypothetical protein
MHRLTKADQHLDAGSEFICRHVLGNITGDIVPIGTFYIFFEAGTRQNEDHAVAKLVRTPDPLDQFMTGHAWHIEICDDHIRMRENLSRKNFQRFLAISRNDQNSAVSATGKASLNEHNIRIVILNQKNVQNSPLTWSDTVQNLSPRCCSAQVHESTNSETAIGRKIDMVVPAFGMLSDCNMP